MRHDVPSSGACARRRARRDSGHTTAGRRPAWGCRHGSYLPRTLLADRNAGDTKRQDGCAGLRSRYRWSVGLLPMERRKRIAQRMFHLGRLVMAPAVRFVLWRMLARSLLDVLRHLQQVRYWDLQYARNLKQYSQRRIADSTFDLADVSSVDLGVESKQFLRQTARLARLSHIRRQNSLDFFKASRHFARVLVMRLSIHGISSTFESVSASQEPLMSSRSRLHVQ